MYYSINLVELLFSDHVSLLSTPSCLVKSCFALLYLINQCTCKLSFCSSLISNHVSLLDGKREREREGKKKDRCIYIYSSIIFERISEFVTMRLYRGIFLRSIQPLEQDSSEDKEESQLSVSYSFAICFSGHTHTHMRMYSRIF